MGLDKGGINISKEIIAWARTGKSLLATKPIKIDTKDLKYASELKPDTFVRKVETWHTPESNVLPMPKRKNCC